MNKMVCAKKYKAPRLYMSYGFVWFKKEMPITDPTHAKYISAETVMWNMPSRFPYAPSGQKFTL